MEPLGLEPGHRARAHPARLEVAHSVAVGRHAGLMEPEVLAQLSGELIPFAVPAEEFIEVTHRLQLREDKKVEFLGGKQELIRLGEFDDVDIAMMCHTASDMGDRKFAVGGTSNGHVVKYVQFKGRGAHAGSAPHRGINALNAASFAIQAMNSNREIFRSEDTVRVHGIMTQGGEAVSAVPSDVRLEWRVRSGSPQAVVKNSASVDRCFKAGALAVGADVHPLTRTLLVRLALLDKALLVNGDLATMTLPAQVDGAGFWLPATALGGGVRGLWNVLVMVPQQEAGEYRLQARVVEVRYVLEQRAFVGGDLRDGEVIVAAGLQRVVAGQLVRTDMSAEAEALVAALSVQP